MSVYTYSYDRTLHVVAVENHCTIKELSVITKYVKIETREKSQALYMIHNNKKQQNKHM